MRCRKNYRDLTSIERDRLVQALYHVKATGIVDQYAAEHETHFSHGIHTSSHFLPWHRDFIRRFEDALRTHHPAVTLPYWNSVVTRAPPIRCGTTRSSVSSIGLGLTARSGPTRCRA
jgi:methionyl-tRNA formyltransferase